jgi:predicted nucleic acid-binding protein
MRSQSKTSVHEVICIIKGKEEHGDGGQMLVILDTNIIVADFRLAATSSRLLIENLKQAGHDLAVPEIVVQEAINKFREKLADDTNKMLALAQSVSRKLVQRFVSSC